MCAICGKAIQKGYQEEHRRGVHQIVPPPHRRELAELGRDGSERYRVLFPPLGLGLGLGLGVRDRVSAVPGRGVSGKGRITSGDADPLLSSARECAGEPPRGRPTGTPFVRAVWSAGPLEGPAYGPPPPDCHVHGGSGEEAEEGAGGGSEEDARGDPPVEGDAASDGPPLPLLGEDRLVRRCRLVGGGEEFEEGEGEVDDDLEDKRTIKHNNPPTISSSLLVRIPPAWASSYVGPPFAWVTIALGSSWCVDPPGAWILLVSGSSWCGVPRPAWHPPGAWGLLVWGHKSVLRQNYKPRT